MGRSPRLAIAFVLAVVPGALAADPPRAVRPTAQVDTVLVEDLRQVFEADRGRVRLVMLLSPT